MQERYHITGMTCSACSAHVEKAANKLNGVEKASVNLLTETMDITYDEQVLQEQDIIKAVEKAGYGAERMRSGRGGNAGGKAAAAGSVSGDMTDGVSG
ncbi:MAG: cation transporter, partial [Acetatifactor sp.]|nr:cation transporter [Acetatifactor sp.]